MEDDSWLRYPGMDVLLFMMGIVCLQSIYLIVIINILLFIPFINVDVLSVKAQP